MAREQAEDPLKRFLFGIIQQFRPDQRQGNSDIKCSEISNIASALLGGFGKDTPWSVGSGRCPPRSQRKAWKNRLHVMRCRSLHATLDEALCGTDERCWQRHGDTRKRGWETSSMQHLYTCPAQQICHVSYSQQGYRVQGYLSQGEPISNSIGCSECLTWKSRN